MAEHILVIDDTEQNNYRIECTTPGGCGGWQECDGDHEGYDPDDETSPAYDHDDEFEIHGVTHQWHWGHGWTVPFEGCVVAEWTGDLPDELWDREVDRWKPGRWLVDDDWDDTDCTLILVGPEGDDGGE